jgi:hypothetical protein
MPGSMDEIRLKYVKSGLYMGSGLYMKSDLYMKSG